VLLLFDIDGTLLLRASAEHVAAVHEALERVYELVDPPKHAIEAAGRTDIEIARAISLVADLRAATFDARLDDFRVACAEAYARLVPADLSDRIAPGMTAVLEALQAREDIHLSLLTGNLEAVARIKLRAAGLDRFFPGGQGGFGSDHEDRTELPAIARRRARAYNGGTPYPRSRTVVIGDTPRDIACAHADGLRCVAVASGPYTVDQLLDADVVVASARDLLDVLTGL
jgi:phosphoglycolate phosphatase